MKPIVQIHSLILFVLSLACLLFVSGGSAFAADVIQPSELPPAVQKIDAELSKLQKVVSKVPIANTQIGKVRVFTVYFDATGAARKATFSQTNIFFHEWYFAGEAGDEKPIFAKEKGTFSYGKRNTGSFRQWAFFTDGVLTEQIHIGDDKVERVVPKPGVWDVNASIRAGQWEVISELMKPLRPSMKP